MGFMRDIMKKVILATILCICSISSIYAQVGSNFNNQKFLMNKIEVNLELIKNLTQNILNNTADTPQTRSDLVLSINKKERCVNEITEILCKEFLQKYILPNDRDLNEKLALVHKMLNLCFLLKTTVDITSVNEFDTNLQLFKDQLKFNYQNDPEYRPSRYRKYRKSRNY